MNIRQGVSRTAQVAFFCYFSYFSQRAFSSYREVLNMEFYSFFVTVMQGYMSVLARIPVGSGSVLGVIVASILLGMIIRSFIVTSR